MALLELSVKESGYGAVTVLRDLAMHVEDGEIVAVLGANGAGKTTLLRTISGLLVRARGELHFDGRATMRVPAHKRARSGIVHVPEGRHVFPGLTVSENLRMGAYSRGGDAQSEAAQRRVHELFPVLRDRADQQATALSGGQQQMLAIGRGLMAEPRLLMVDEASLGLSPTLTQQMFDAFDRIRQDGTAVLIVEQNARGALGVADRAYILERGRVALAGTTAELRSDDRVVHLYLGGHSVAS